MFNKFFIGVFCLFIGIQLNAQKISGFRQYKNLSLKGDARVIGNNVVSMHATNPYNDVGRLAMKNDRISMTYIDIDDDPNTFSSSSANLTIPESMSSIVYASLHWVATYEHEEAKMKLGKSAYEYVPVKPRVETFYNVLLKTPESTYKPIQGIIVEDHKDSIGRPYLCYADITKVLQNSSKISGTYTVANVRATQGHILGGSSGGWMMYVVYKDENLPQKRFTLFNGFQSVEKSEFELSVRATDSTYVTLGVLEGDERLKTDKLSLKYSEEMELQTIFSRVRPAQNYFNSSITINDEIFKERNPNSINTLGFDIAHSSLPINKSNLKGELKLNLTTVRDKFFLFFTAMQTNVPETNLPIEQQLEIASNVAEISNDITLLAPIKVRQTLKVPNQKAGFYLVTNVFSDKKLANNWKQHVINDGFTPESFINAENNWEYVYINYSTKVEDLYLDYNQFKTKDSYKEIWILEIED